MEDTTRTATVLACLALLLTAARADLPPVPDRGPPSASVAGLKFKVQWASVRMPPGYYKRHEIAVLVGCVERRPNCRIAKAKNLIGMQVLSIDGQSLRPEAGMMRQITDAFAHASAKTVTLELTPRETGGESVTVSFARR